MLVQCLLLSGVSATIVWGSGLRDDSPPGGVWSTWCGQSPSNWSPTYTCPQGTSATRIDISTISNPLLVSSIQIQCSDGTWLLAGLNATNPTSLRSSTGWNASEVVSGCSDVTSSVMGVGDTTIEALPMDVPQSWQLMGFQAGLNTTNPTVLQRIRFFFASSVNWRKDGAWTPWCGGDGTALKSIVQPGHQCSPLSWISDLGVVAANATYGNHVVKEIQTKCTNDDEWTLDANFSYLEHNATNISYGYAGLSSNLSMFCGWVVDGLLGFGGVGGGAEILDWIPTDWVAKGWQSTLQNDSNWWKDAGVYAVRFFFGPKPPPPVTYQSSFYAGSWTTFRWVYSSPTWSFSLPTNNLTLEGSFLQLPPFTFPVGTHEFSVRGVADGSGEIVVYDGFITVIPFPLQVTIGGGNQVSPCAGVLTNVTASWDTTMTQDPIVNWTGNCVYVGMPVGATVTVDAAALTPCTATVVVQSSTTTLTHASVLFAVPSSICGLTITGPLTVNSDNTIRLLGSTTTPLPTALSFSWTIPSELASCLPNAGIVATRALVISPGCLQQGATYSIVLTATSTNPTLSVSTNVTINVRRNPFGGQCNVQQLNASIALVQVNCSGWQSDSLTSLTYSVYDLVSSYSTSTTGTQSSNTTTRVPVTGAELTELMDVYLLAGLHNLQAVISTAEGTETDVLLSITVTGSCQSQSAMNSSSSTVVGNDALAFSIYQLACDNSGNSWQNLQSIINDSINLQYLAPADVDLLANAIGAWAQYGVNATAALNNSTQNSSAFDLQVLDTLSQFVQLQYQGDALLASGVMQQSVAGVVARGDCQDVVNPILQQLAALNTLAVGAQSPGEPQTSISTQLSYFEAASVLSSSSGDSATFGANTNNPLQFQLPSVNSNEDVVRSTVTQYQLTGPVAHCRQVDPNSYFGAQPLVPVNDVNVLNPQGTPAVIKDNSLSLEFAVETPDCGYPVCAWWDAGNSSGDGHWSLDGCRGYPSGVPDHFTCVCSHLTEFTLLLGGCPSNSERSGYMALLVLYSLLAAIATGLFAQRIGRDYATPKQYRRPHFVICVQHVLVAVVCILRAVTCAVLGQFMSTRLFDVRAALLMGPYLFVFWIYTILVFGWARLHHFTMKAQAHNRPTLILFFITNILILIGVVTVVAVVVKAQDEAQTTPSVADGGSQAARAGTIFLAVVTIISAIGFFAYSLLLRRDMATGDASSKGGGGRGVFGLKFADRLLIFGMVSSGLLIIQSGLHIASGVAPLYGPNGTQIALLFFDWLFLVAVLSMYFKAMVQVPASSVKATKSENVSNKSTTRTQSILMSFRLKSSNPNQ